MLQKTFRLVELASFPIYFPNSPILSFEIQKITFKYLFFLCLKKCEWKSLSGVNYDLKGLTVPKGRSSYYIKDGDIPCTAESEPTYSFIWNICADVTNLPPVCVNTSMYPVPKTGAALQFIDATVRSDGYKECEIIGLYDPKNDDSVYKLLNEADPSAGISMTYHAGDKCPNKVPRTTTIDLICENIKEHVVSALEPTKCGYHMVMKSWYGCPKSCPITSSGLCNSHGHCAYDKVSRSAYCYCNEGYSGDDCTILGVSPTSKGYDGYSVQIGLLITLLVITILLTGVVAFVIFRITELRCSHLHFLQ